MKSSRKNARRGWSEFRVAIGLAVGLLAKTKPELIEALKKIDGDARLEPDAPEALLGLLVQGREFAEDFLKLINGAECRVAVALANIRPE